MLLSATAYGQTYSYSFKGELSTENIHSIEKECSGLTEVKWTKCRYKVDRQAGELIIEVKKGNPEDRREDKQLFSPIEVKQMLRAHNLEPLDFRTLTK